MIPLKQILQGLRPMARPSRGRMLLSVLIGLVRIAASLSFVWICKRLVDIATGVSDAPLGVSIGILVGIMLIQMACSVSASAWANYNAVRTANDLRADVFSTVLRSTWCGRERFRSGDAVNRLEEDVRVVTDLLCARFPDTAITLIQLLAASVYLLLMAPKLLWVLVILMVVGVAGSRLFFRTLRALTERIRKSDAEIQQLPEKLAQSEAFVNAVHNSDSDTAQIQCNTDLFQIVIEMMAENTEFARNYLDNETFRNFVNTRVFQQARAMV